jgi:hypothetical protein
VTRVRSAHGPRPASSIERCHTTTQRTTTEIPVPSSTVPVMPSIKSLIRPAQAATVSATVVHGIGVAASPGQATTTNPANGNVK